MSLNSADLGARSKERLTSIDALRGVIIVLMALDHARDFIHYPIDPVDIPHTNAPLFLTRWITHFCAPVFMLLAGTGAYLSLSKGKTKGDLSRFLITRGLWLVLLELTVVRSLGWLFNFDYHLVLVLVIWALGWSMVALAGFIWLPPRVLAAVCVIGIAGHNALDGVVPAGPFGWLWRILHVPGVLVPIAGFQIAVGYVLVPWVFVMALGYCLGPIFRWEPERRRRALLLGGAAATVAFVVLRATQIYGNPTPWTHQRTWLLTLFSFLSCHKYPPSLCYLLMTLGPACIALALLERWRGRLADIALVFGRVPLFFYLLHIPAIHLAAVVAALLRYGHAGFLFQNPTGDDDFFPAPPGYGYPLAIVYLVWLAVVAALYPLCRRYAEYKRTHSAAWLSYL